MLGEPLVSLMSKHHSNPCRPVRVFLALIAGLASPSLRAESPPPRVELFDLAAVELLPGPFRAAQERNLAYVLALEVDRLVAPFRREAGLEPKAEPYPNWESSGLDGHTAGHYLTALAQHAVVSDSAEARERLAYMVAELAACQAANGEGYIGGVPGGQEAFRKLREGQLEVNNFGLNGKWVPWYNLHKTFAGLRDAWLLTGNEQARDVLVRFSDWALQILDTMTDEQVQAMLQCEHGGMNEVLADVAAISGEPRFLEGARRFSHRLLLDPLLAHRDALTGLHANTQIPKVIGFARIAELADDPSWADAAAFFWNTVVHDRSVAIGGNSVREHFHPADDFSSMIRSREGPETCNTYNMLRLTERLFRRGAEGELADFYERALYNHILSSQHPEHGGYVYFTPMRPRHYRVYSQPEKCFWCCVGSGMENHGKYGQFIYAHEGDETLLVNLFIPSKLEWAERGISLVQENDFPRTPSTRLRFEMAGPQSLVVALRQPAWTSPEGPSVRLNGRLLDLSSAPGDYLRIDREWMPGDTLEIEFPMHLALERLPDGSDYAAIVYGPIVLGAAVPDGELPGLIADDGRMAHAAPGAYLPLDQAPMLVGTDSSILDAIEPVPGRPLTFRAPAAIRPDRFDALELRPFHTLHDTRYELYWRIVPENQYAEVIAKMAADEATRLALEARTLDAVSPGEQQPEVEHDFRAEEPLQGVHLGRPWRAARKWFSYRLDAGGTPPATLLLTFFAGERGRTFDLIVDGETLATLDLEGDDPDTFSDRLIPIPGDLAARWANNPLEVKFAAREGSLAGALYGLRLLRAEAPPSP